MFVNMTSAKRGDIAIISFKYLSGTLYIPTRYIKSASDIGIHALALGSIVCWFAWYTYAPVSLAIL